MPSMHNLQLYDGTEFNRRLREEPHELVADLLKEYRVLFMDHLVHFLHLQLRGPR
jgi:hypothetical protein